MWRNPTSSVHNYIKDYRFGQKLVAPLGVKGRSFEIPEGQGTGQLFLQRSLDPSPKASIVAAGRRYCGRVLPDCWGACKPAVLSAAIGSTTGFNAEVEKDPSHFNTHIGIDADNEDSFIRFTYRDYVW